MWRDKIPSGKVARFAMHTSLLFAAMAAPFFLLDIGTASPVAFGAAITVVALSLVLLHLRDRGKSKQPAKIVLLQLLYGLSVPLATFGLMLLLIFEWYMWAYRPVTIGMWDGLLTALIVVTVVLIYPPILFLLLGPRLARKGGGDASRFLKGVRARGFGWFQINWLSNTVGAAGSFSLISVLLLPRVLQDVERWRDSDGVVTNWELVAAYPFLPFAVLATAAMLALGIILIADREADNAVVQAYIDGAAEAPSPDARTRTALGMLVAGACVTALLIIVYPLHLHMTAKGVRDGQVALYGAIDAISILANTHEDDDWTVAESVEALNRLGYWSPDAPRAGLGSLVADPGKSFPETCTVRVAVGTIGPTAAGEAEPEGKFCAAVACAPPFTWSAPPALMLVTSHNSQAEGWWENLYVDVSASGRTPAPGGYCTADGRLADEFQG